MAVGLPQVTVSGDKRMETVVFLGIGIDDPAIS
jgi:hypothetical protein